MRQAFPSDWPLLELLMLVFGRPWEQYAYGFVEGLSKRAV
jgi:hypothetical protein